MWKAPNSGCAGHGITRFEVVGVDSLAGFLLTGGPQIHRHPRPVPPGGLLYRSDLRVGSDRIELQKCVRLTAVEALRLALEIGDGGLCRGPGPPPPMPMSSATKPTINGTCSVGSVSVRTQPSFKGLRQSGRRRPPAGGRKIGGGKRPQVRQRTPPFDSVYFTSLRLRLSVIVFAPGRLPRQQTGSALRDRTNEESFRARRTHQAPDRKCAGRLPEYRDLFRISAKNGDVLLHPLQRRNLIEDAVVAGDVVLGFFRQLRMCQEAEADPGDS